MTISHNMWSRAALESHSVDLRQFVGFRSSSLPNGVRQIEAYNASGLRYTLLPDRGLDIWSADFRGLPLTWIAAASPFPPDFGQTWLQQFNGGLLTTCGLTHVGPPEHDTETGAFRDLHGLYSRLRASEPSIDAAWEGDDYVLRMRAEVVEGWLHGYHLRLRRTYELSLSAPDIRLHDTVTNVGDAPTPLMILYHFNVGYPLVRQGARLEASGQLHPRDDEARRGLNRWAEYDAASAGYREQVFLHHVQVNSDGESEAAVFSDGDLALGLRWQGSALPYLTQWKNQRHGMYVHGIEPGNCVPEGQNAARAAGRLRWITPGETIDCGRIVLSLYADAEAIGGLRVRLDTLRTQGQIAPGAALA
jgi:hypothetical protein